MRIAYLQGQADIEPDLFKEGRVPIYKNPLLMAKAKQQFLDDYNKKLKETTLTVVTDSALITETP